ncbi:hypothetical protein BN863_28510 [Formosa agariphila KMM 3901]|uniref:Uncharacterized protein n=1 Tax=Formosa agariphila (strain DSM 15362 / KCTC 12365 / LMG 23005 / KMM 3901 / M-2Alg 35-1) TaxID=1347342 RepID=T2KPY4_FORAG|nr:hypothetical protein [Formosa agariphila]CDF80563.1 hypothetical protein BN863_28510 [Formosa agariphila KMM 3901]
MIEVLKPYISEIILGIGGLGAWLFERKKRIQGFKQDDADLTSKIQGIYKDMVADSDASLDKMRGDMELLKKRQGEIDEQWRQKIQQVERRWQTKYSRLQKSYNELLKEFEEYKLAHEK